MPSEMVSSLPTDLVYVHHLDNVDVEVQRPHASSRVLDLENYEKAGRSKYPFVLNGAEMRILGIAGVGFFLDAYDLFIINQVSTMFQYEWFGGATLPSGREGVLKAGANIGAVIGQFLFGYLGDALGRKRVYGKELMVIIFATILTISVPAYFSGLDALTWVTIFRVVLGIGIGGDYPMSASVSTDRASLRRRGTMLGYIFSAQGWGSLAGCIVTMVVLAAYKQTMDVHGHVHKVDGVWRIIVGVSLVPAFATLYHRLTLPKRRIDPTEKKQSAGATIEKSASDSSLPRKFTAPKDKKAHFTAFFHYFKQWRHARVLLATAGCWFLVDIAFYGVNLNSSVLLQRIGFQGKLGRWYYVTVLTVEYLGRKWIQIQGFLMTALFLGILAGRFNELSTIGFCVCFAFLQFFFNFGANSTTYMYPAEVFPTKFRSTAHGISAASGKAGAIISSLAFNSLSKKIGTAKVLWSEFFIYFFMAFFAAVCLAGALLSVFLPEVKNRDPDVVLAEEEEEDRRLGRPIY
ncbi:hypothetical protein BS47DRAFT_1371753 [Hydnum rufescens UP504]|uniref:Major facilitator superfamily (MFS) profile domain-containing protein n=1 Tax=Hydnum rufescens UP504 TaxID=1448309 RepID=A0A9P6B2L2_9AGAM|nr:hypothetical protein BS47DRAFT_1371753 [Hydnum rufescens UP504]